MILRFAQDDEPFLASLPRSSGIRHRVAAPFSPVPMTMQPLAVLLVGASLGAKRGAVAAGIYLLQGAAGLPVFAHPLGRAASARAADRG